MYDQRKKKRTSQGKMALCPKRTEGQIPELKNAFWAAGWKDIVAATLGSNFQLVLFALGRNGTGFPLGYLGEFPLANPCWGLISWRWGVKRRKIKDCLWNHGKIKLSWFKHPFIHLCLHKIYSGKGGFLKLCDSVILETITLPQLEHICWGFWLYSDQRFDPDDHLKISLSNLLPRYFLRIWAKTGI